VVELSACVKGSNRRRCTSGAMPMPVSRTSKRTTHDPGAWSRREARTVTAPVSVNLSALPTRLMSVWRSRSASPRSIGGTASPMSTSSGRPFAWAASVKSFSTSGHHRPRLEVDRLELELPRLHLREVEDLVEDRQQGLARVRDRPRVLALGAAELGAEQQVRHAHHAVHGVRISWLMLARKSLFARFARSPRRAPRRPRRGRARPAPSRRAGRRALAHEARPAAGGAGPGPRMRQLVGRERQPAVRSATSA
jgi:hypothetical protein